MNPKLLPILLPAMCLTAWSAPVSFDSLLHEMTDRGQLARYPDPAYACRQFSSYDRRSTSPDDKSTWFANNDRTQFLRSETNAGRTELVMMDHTGPGAVVRFWVTWNKHPKNILRVYLDGATEPAIEGTVPEFIDGGLMAGKPLGFRAPEASSYDRSGHNLYLPIPYQKGCKVTVEGPVDYAFYYNINYRSYEDGTKVRTFSMDDLATHKAAIERTQAALLEDAASTAKPAASLENISLPPGTGKSLKLQGGAAIHEIALKLAADDLDQALRSTVMEIRFDGNRTVWCPLGDFFGIGHRANRCSSWQVTAAEDGSLRCRWVMPFEKEAEVIFHNLGKQEVRLAFARVFTSPWTWDERSMHFHANWKQFTKLKTQTNDGATGRAFDVNYVTLQGRGVYVGDTLTVFNGYTGKKLSWWGEGDEKIYVDGEKFPSHFGTGTEDYYGYAWSRPEPFSTPFITQPVGECNISGPGLAVNSRYRLLDGIPFKESLKLDMEVWHHQQTVINYAPTTFWYALPGATSDVQPDPESAALAVPKSAADLE